MFCLCSGNRFFHFSLFPRVIDGCLPFIPYIYYIQDYFLYYILVCLSKVFQRTIFSFKLPLFSGKAFAKVRRFVLTSKFFQSFFWKKFSEGFPKACGLPFLAPLHICKVRYSVQQPALSSVTSASLSLSSSAALPLESGCKGTDFFHFRNFYGTLFCKVFSGFWLTRWFVLCYTAWFLLI